MADEWITLRDRLRLQLRPIERWPGQMHKARRPSPFTAKLGNTIQLLTRELNMLNAKNIVLQIAIEEGGFRLDGLPRAQARAEHPGVILAFESQHGPLSLPCDTYTTWQANLRAIAMHLENLRHAGLHGVGQHGEQYRGWKALPPGAGETVPSGDAGMTVETAAASVARLAQWWGLIGTLETNAGTYATVLKRVRVLCHPDRNHGRRDDWNLLEEAAAVLDQHHGKARMA